MVNTKEEKAIKIDRFTDRCLVIATSQLEKRANWLKEMKKKDYSKLNTKKLHHELACIPEDDLESYTDLRDKIIGVYHEADIRFRNDNYRNGDISIIGANLKLNIFTLVGVYDNGFGKKETKVFKTNNDVVKFCLNL